MKKQIINKLSLFLCVFITIAFTNFTKAFAETLPSRMYVDTPTLNQNIYNKNFNISGWALNASGIKEINVYIDDSFKGKATYSLYRPDVAKAFKGYINGNNSGFTYPVDINTISSGTHKISVYAIGNNGTSQLSYLYINIIKKVPRMYIDYPTTNFSTTQRNLTVSGWSLNSSGIKTIQYYLNNQLIGTSGVGISRPDVNTAFPGYLNGSTSGFSFSFNVMNYILPGTQNASLKVVSIGNDGTSSTITQNLILTKLPEKICIDTPQNNATVKNNITINGWSLNASGVKSVNVYLDGVFNGKASYGSYRPDVNSAFPGYTDGSKSGFNYTLNTSTLSIGNHTLRIDSIGNDGRVARRYINFNFYGSVNYQYYNYTLDYMANVQLSVGAVYQNTTTWTWDPASYDMIRQYVDAPSIVNDSYAKYEFLKLSYSDGSSLSDLNNILNNKGFLTNKGQVFLNSAQLNNVNPIYLISHALLETGNGTSSLAQGILVSSVDGHAVTPKIVYNFFGIGAYDSDPNKYGSEYAYKQGWFTVDAAINGGAAFISRGYINSSTNQDTLYKMRWNPETPGTHQYATDVRWAYNQVNNIKYLIDQCSNSTLYFNIPIFN